MNVQTRISLVVGALVVLVIGAFFLVSANKDDETATDPPSSEQSTLVREDSHVLGQEGSSDVTFVEFLDFQCPSCGAMHPVVEDLRERYAGEVTFVLRQFPLPMHPNAQPAALAVEAAAAQGKVTEMYNAVFDAQAEWSDLDPEAAAQQFRDLAEGLGLDLAQYDADLAAPEAAERIERDVADGVAAGVQGTPTIFVDGEMLQPESYQDITDAVEEALAQ